MLINTSSNVLLFIFLSIFFTTSHSIAPSKHLKTASGIPVSCYGLGGAARSTQPSSLASVYFNELQQKSKNVRVAPFYFYYNPHRYPEFLSGIRQVCSTYDRQDIFVASGGTDRSYAGLDQRLDSCLEHCGGEYLDLFIIEYVLPEELIYDNDVTDENISSLQKPGPDLKAALEHAQKWVHDGIVKSVGISTHSHRVGAALSKSSEVDILMLRYGMSHKDAAENISFPAARENEKPVIAFTSTRWNALQGGIDNSQEWPHTTAPTSAECLSFVFGDASVPPVDAVLHSARDENELLESMSGLMEGLPDAENQMWRKYGMIFEDLNEDFFDEYPEERSM